MALLTPLDRIYILAGCGGIILATIFLMACKILPFCWLHKVCPFTKHIDENEDPKKKRPHEPHQQHITHQPPPRYGTSPSPIGNTTPGRKPPLPLLHYPDTPNGCAPSQPAWIQDESDSLLSAYSAASEKRRSLRSHLPPYISTANTSMSEASEAEPSPALRKGSCFSALTDDKFSFRGTLDIVLQYNLAEERLLVLVKTARSLPFSFYGTANDVYIKAYLIRDQRRRWRTRSSNITVGEIQSDRSGSFAISEFKTKLVRRSTNPVFNDQFEALLKDRDRKYASLKFIAFTSDRFSHQSMSGEINLPLRRLDLVERREFSLKLHEMEQNLGDIFLSLSYLPTSERLSVSIFKCVGLQNVKDDTQSPSPYVRAITLLRTKTLEKHKVEAQLNTKNPIFNETLTFNLRADDLDRVVLVVTVCHKDVESEDSPTDTDAAYSSGMETFSRSSSTPPAGKDTYHRSRRKSMGNLLDVHERTESPSLQNGSYGSLSLNHKSKSTNCIRPSSSVIGRLAFGSNTGGETQAHWLDAMRNPRKQFSRWHKLES